MTFRVLATWATFSLVLLLSACGGGSGRSGTDLVVTGVGPSSGVKGGDPAVFVMTVANRGDFSATDLVIKNATLQLSQPLLMISCTAKGGAECPAVTGPSMSVSSLPPDGKLVFEVSSTANLGASGLISNTMSVSAGSRDTDSTNNTFTASSAVTSNDLGVTATAPAGPLLSGPATFTMVVSNAGPDEALNVALTTTLSADLTLAPAGVVCTPSGGAVAPVLQTDGSLLSPSVPANGVLTCTVNVSVGSGTGGFAIVTLVASALGDSRTSNNSGTATVSTTLSNDVSVVGTPPPGPLLSGAATFKMVVANAGPDKAQNVALTTTVSAELTLVRENIVCVPSGGAVVPTLQADGTLLSTSMPSGSALSCSIPVTVAPATSAFAAVTMAASSAGDSRTGNNSATASVSATLSNNVNVTGSAAASSVIGGKSTTFKYLVGNTGPATAFDVVLSNTPGANLALSGAIACVASGGAVAPVVTVGGGLNAPSIPLGGLLTCTVPLTVAAGANGTVTSTFTATAAGDQRASDNSATVATVAVSSNLGVSQTGAVQVAAGSATTFTALVSNPGPGTASNLQITWTHTNSSSLVFDTPTCTGSGGAICPSVLGPTMTVPSLGVARTLAFTFKVTPSASFRGNIVNTVAVTSNEDQDLSNNSASATTVAVDALNGSYTAFAANGRSYNLAIDFDARQYTMSGSGSTTTTRTFTRDSSTGDYVVSGTARLRTGQDLVVGGHDFGDGVLPFLAARIFSSGLSALAGSYNLATRNVDSAGVATTRPGTALISGNTLSVCQSETDDVVPVRNCSAAARKDYLSLSISGSVATGTTSGGEIYSFSVANSGAAKVLLSTGAATDGSEQLRIGLIDSAAGLTYGPAVRGPTSTGDWWSATLTFGAPPIFAAVGTNTSDTVSLLNISNSGSGPFSLLEGTSPTYNALVYVMQASPLVIVVGGSPAYAGASSGFLQFGLP